MVLACHPGERGSHSIGGEMCGNDGYFLFAGRSTTHEARQTGEAVFFLTFTPAVRARDLAEALAEVRGLP